MLDTLVAGVGNAVHANPWLAVVAVFLGGVLTASNPCVLVMIPLMMSFVAGRRDEGAGVLRAFLYSFMFILGLSATFMAMGMTAALAGTMYGNVSGWWNWVVAAVCIVMGLHLTGIVHINIPMPFRVQPRTRGMVGALILGLLFGVVSAPCAAPMLVVLLTYLAGSNASVSYGGFLLLVYALGHSVLILLAGTSVGAARRLMESRKMARGFDLLRRGAGVVVIIVGLYFAVKGIT